MSVCMSTFARYLVRLENSSHAAVGQYGVVRAHYRDILARHGCTINSARISSFAVEVDFFSKEAKSAEEGIKALGSEGKVLSITDLMADEIPAGKQETLEQARLLFNQERFWEVHEKVEGVWRAAAGEEKAVQQSIILYASALVHYQKNETETTLRMLRRALERMKWAKDNYYSFDLAMMRREAESMLASGRVHIFRLRSSARP